MDVNEKVNMALNILQDLNILPEDKNLILDKSNEEKLFNSFCKVYSNARNNGEKLTTIEIAVAAVDAMIMDIIYLIKSGEFDGKLDEVKVNKKLIKLDTLKNELVKLRIKNKKRIRKNKVKTLYKKNYKESME